MLTGVQTLTVSMEISVAFPLGPGNRSNIRFSYTKWLYSQRTPYLTLRDNCQFMFIYGLPIISSNWKQPRCTLIDEWIRKMMHLHMEYRFPDNGGGQNPKIPR